MPECKECSMLSENKCLAYEENKHLIGRPIPPPPLGSCAIPIVKGYLDFIQPGMRVLEIGCGSWDLVKSHCQKVGAVYEGIDTEAEYYGKKTVATRLENLANLSFPDEHFDIVIGNQTMEHWPENGCSLEWGLFQCFRVCKSNGQVLLNVPIHFHGSKIFMLGNIDAIKALFSSFSNRVNLTKWGSPSIPFNNLFPWPGYSQLEQKPAYVLDIVATKDKETPTSFNNRFAFGGRLAELVHYPISFNLYRILRKAGFFPAPKEAWELGDES